MGTQAEQKQQTLERTAPGENGVILQVGSQRGAVKRRLVDMGLTPDRVVTIAGDVRPLEESWAVLAS